MMKLDNDMEPGTRLFLKVGFFPGQGLKKTVAGVVRRLFVLEKRMMAGIKFVVAERFSDHFSSDDLTKLLPPVKRFDRRVQNRLVSYLFQREIELRKKGLL